MTPLTTYTCGVETSGGECTDTTYTHTHVASTAKESAVIALCGLTASTVMQLIVTGNTTIMVTGNRRDLR